jgi:hypothetical protein
MAMALVVGLHIGPAHAASQWEFAGDIAGTWEADTTPPIASLPIT